VARRAVVEMRKERQRAEANARSAASAASRRNVAVVWVAAPLRCLRCGWVGEVPSYGLVALNGLSGQSHMLDGLVRSLD
jgi:hypothetical protein